MKTAHLRATGWFVGCPECEAPIPAPRTGSTAWLMLDLLREAGKKLKCPNGHMSTCPKGGWR